MNNILIIYRDEYLYDNRFAQNAHNNLSFQSINDTFFVMRSVYTLHTNKNAFHIYLLFFTSYAERKMQLKYDFHKNILERERGGGGGRKEGREREKKKRLKLSPR